MKWTAKQDRHSKLWFVVDDDNSDLIAECHDKKNAELIAALPEMVEALRLLYDSWDIMKDGPDDSDVAMAQERIGQGMTLAHSILKKAK